ncbi:MAG: histidine kinase [Bacteroidota bacterium]
MQGENKKYRSWSIVIHLLFWVSILVLMLLIFHSIFSQWDIALLAASINLLGLLLLVYIHLFILIPKLFDEKRYWIYGISVFILLIITALFRFFTGWGLVKMLFPSITEMFTPTYFGSLFFTGTFFLLVAIPLRLVDNWLKKQELEKELKTHQLEAELRFLKAQVNPHFLFNALNNIYSLSFTESKKAPEIILKLSDMMSYMLYDCKHEQVSLSAEVNYLKNYIALQQLKKEGEFNIDFQVKGNIDDTFITPMLFIPLFENAFKHGNLEDTRNGWLKSELECIENRLLFSISNSKLVERKSLQKGGVGLENLKERLKLLFPNQHELDIKSTENEYQVNLTINLNENEL